jgi:hypothetical protein
MKQAKDILMLIYFKYRERIIRGFGVMEARDIHD